ncbi:hypothetical protein I3760_05G185300 [Carya illinoinensis]|nr:hypothetical protein I3760_05G185300 [Carya illinoinensis]
MAGVEVGERKWQSLYVGWVSRLLVVAVNAPGDRARGEVGSVLGGLVLVRARDGGALAGWCLCLRVGGIGWLAGSCLGGRGWLAHAEEDTGSEGRSRRNKEKRKRKIEKNEEREGGGGGVKFRDETLGLGPRVPFSPCVPFICSIFIVLF